MGHGGGAWWWGRVVGQGGRAGLGGGLASWGRGGGGGQVQWRLGVDGVLDIPRLCPSSLRMYVQQLWGKRLPFKHNNTPFANRYIPTTFFFEN